MGWHYKKIIGGTCLVAGCIFAVLWSRLEVPAPVTGIIIPHHDLVASVRDAYLSEVAKLYQPKTIILVAPNHFDAGSAPILTSEESWNTSFGEILPDHTVIVASGVVRDHQSLLKDHSITSPIGVLKKYFPEATIAPFFMRRDATYEEVADLVQRVESVCEDCLVVASVDFSHTNAAALADLHDSLIWRHLANADSKGLYSGAEVDSPESLTFLSLWAAHKNAKVFSLYSHTNSGHMTDTQYGEVTSHIIGGYGRALQDLLHKDRESSVTFMIGGDVMFARGVHSEHQFDAKSALIKGLGERFFWGVDVAMINLEGVFSTSTNQEQAWYTMPPQLVFSGEYIDALRYARINTIAHANNHSHDGTSNDMLYTRDLLQKSGIDYVRGDAVVTKTDGDVKVAFIAGSELPPLVPIAEVVSEYSQAGYVTVVYLHFGNEYESKASETQYEQAKSVIDSGADLVVGTHPHVVQPVAEYKNVPIVYSLGNLLFDQNASTAVTEGLVLGGRVLEDTIEVFLLPVYTYLNPTLNALQAVDTTPWYGYEHTAKPYTYQFPLTN